MAAFPPPPVNTIDWSNVGFKVREGESPSSPPLHSYTSNPFPPVNGHIESTYSKTTGQWSPLTFVADPFMRIHGMAPALNYGQQAYEGLKAFRGPGDKTISIFRPDRNAVRLQHSADVVSMPRVPESMFLDAVRAAVALNAGFVPPHETGAAMYIRPQLYGSSAQLGLSPPEEYVFAVFVIPTGVYHGVQPVRALILEDFDRAAPNGTGNAKVGGNYAPVLRWSDKARTEGYGITLHLDSARHEEIDEFSTSGFIGVRREGEELTMVVPDSTCVIDSVTSQSVQEIAKSWGWKVEKRPVSCPSPSDSVTETDLGRIDQLPRAPRLHRGLRRRHRRRPRAHPLHHAPRRRFVAAVPPRHAPRRRARRCRQGRRGDCHLHPR
jgi:branched-chain amino acid aminotransferase